MNRKEACKLLGVEFRGVESSEEINIGWLMSQVHTAIHQRVIAFSDIEDCGISFAPVIASSEYILMMSDCGRIIALTCDQYGVVQNLYDAEIYEAFLKHDKLAQILPVEVIGEIKRLETLEAEAERQYYLDRQIAILKEIANEYPEVSGIVRRTLPSS